MSVGCLPGRDLINIVGTIRARKDFDSLQRPQQLDRIAQGRKILNTLKIPPEALVPPPTTPPAELLHLPTAVRNSIRTIPSINIPCEKQMNKLKKELAVTHGTATKKFTLHQPGKPPIHGSFISDPITLFRKFILTVNVRFAVGGDTGAGQTKLGVTYSRNDVQYFISFLNYEGMDDVDCMHALAHEAITIFTGESAVYPHIFALLQHLLDSHPNSVLNGDWCFINVVRGIMGPCATHPCPICVVGKKNFIGVAARPRITGDPFSRDPFYPHLLDVPPERVVPTPLHVCLGISNYILSDGLTAIFNEKLVADVVQTVKTTHSPGHGGRGDYFALNGQEISKFLDRDCFTAVRTAAAASGMVITRQIDARLDRLKRWMWELHNNLLHARTWTDDEISHWRIVVDEIQQGCKEFINKNPFPKLHMLSHTVEFAVANHYLGKLGESQIESYHATFNRIYERHKNSSHHTPERMRRSHADLTLCAIQPLLLK